MSVHHLYGRMGYHDHDDEYYLGNYDTNVVDEMVAYHKNFWRYVRKESPRGPLKSDVICKGCLELNSHCGKCSKCIENGWIK